MKTYTRRFNASFLHFFQAYVDTDIALGLSSTGSVDRIRTILEQANATMDQVQEDIEYLETVNDYWQSQVHGGGDVDNLREYVYKTRSGTLVSLQDLVKTGIVQEHDESFQDFLDSQYYYLTIPGTDYTRVIDYVDYAYDEVCTDHSTE